MFSGTAFSWSKDSLAVAPVSLPYFGGCVAMPAGSYPVMCAWSEGTSAIVYATASGAPESVYQVNAGAGGNVIRLTASAGTTPSFAVACCIYQGRLVVTDGQEVFFSRAGAHDDWDYAKTDLGAAFALSTFLGLNVNDTVLALIPFANDSLLIAGTQSLYLLTGNARDGGRLELVSRNVGILGAKAWAYDPTGAVYFADVSGLWRMTADGQMKNLSRDKVQGYFENIERVNYLTHLVWDEIHKGLWVFLSRKASAASTHLWYDSRTDGFFPQQIPTTQGPVCAMYYEGNLLGDRRVMLGGRDGYVRKFDDTAADDDGTAISSQVYIGPLEPAGATREACCVSLDATLGETPTGFLSSDWNLDASLLCGFDPSSTISTPEQTHTFTSFTAPGRQDTQATKKTAGCFFLKLSNSTLDKIWSVDRLVGRFHIAGKEDGRFV